MGSSKIRRLETTVPVGAALTASPAPEQDAPVQADTYPSLEQPYQAIFEASSDGLTVNDPETGLVLQANPAFCRMHGYADMAGMHPRDFIHPESYHLFEEFAQAIRESREFRSQARDVRRDGSVFDVEVLGRGFIYQGKFAMLGVVRDVSEQVHARQVLEQRVAERTREIERRRAVAEGLRDLLGVVNSSHSLDDILAHVVDQAGRLLGSDAESLYLRDWDNPDVLRLQASREIPSEACTAVLPNGLPAIGLAAMRRRPVLVPDICQIIAQPAAPTFDEQVHDRGAYLEVMRPGPPDANQPLQQQRGHVLAQHFCTVLAVPLLARDQSYGALTLYYRDEHLPSHEEIELIATFAGQAGLAIENARVRQQSEQRLRELEALYEADAALHRSLRLDDVLHTLLDVAREMLHSDAAGLWAPNRENPGEIVPVMSRGVSDRYLHETIVLNRVPAVRDYWGAERLVCEDVLADADCPPAAREALVREGFLAVVNTAIRVGKRRFGTFSLGYHQPRTFSAEELRLLDALAQRAALAIQNAQYFERAQQAAALEERQRLARELHDAVTQTLFSTALLAEVVPELWESDPAEGRLRLEELRRLTRGALAEMRTLLVELRPGALTEMPLADLLRQIAEATAGRTRLEVTVEAAGHSGSPLPPEVQVALYRIAQEALNNVVKHARASHARLHLRFAPDGPLTLSIADDGRGFDPAIIPAGHLGVGIMHERAAAIGATLRVLSGAHPDTGTRVEVQWQPEKD